MGYLTAPGQQRGGYASQFGFGMANPSYGGIRRPSGRVPAGDSGGGGIATAYSQSYLPPIDPATYRPQSTGPTHTGTAKGTYSLNKGGSGFVWDKRNEHVGFNEPGMPDLRELGEVERYTGEKWAPDRRYDETSIDPSEMIESRFALIDERLGGEMSEAARRFGAAGALQSGGGLGGGYAGTLAESERGAMRDKRQIASDRIYAAAQSEAERRARAFESEQGRSLAAHEGFEGRRFADVNMANQYGLSAFDRLSDQDRWRYEQELGIAGREQSDAIAEMLAQYGM